MAQCESDRERLRLCKPRTQHGVRKILDLVDHFSLFVSGGDSWVKWNHFNVSTNKRILMSIILNNATDVPLWLYFIMKLRHRVPFLHVFCCQVIITSDLFIIIFNYIKLKFKPSLPLRWNRIFSTACREHRPRQSLPAGLGMKKATVASLLGNSGITIGANRLYRLLIIINTLEPGSRMMSPVVRLPLISDVCRWYKH